MVIPTLNYSSHLILLRQTTIQKFTPNHSHAMIHSALAGLRAGNNIPDHLDRRKPDRGKPATRDSSYEHTPKATTTNERATHLIFAGDNHRELDKSPQPDHHHNPPAFATAQYASSRQTHGLLCILARFLGLLNVVTTTANAFSAARGSPNMSHFPRKQTWVAPKALPELMNDKYQVHGATESEGDIRTFFIDEGTKANKPAWDLMLMEEETADVAVSDAMHGAHAQNKSVSAPTQSWEAIGSKALLIDEGTQAQHNRPPFDVIYMEDDGKEDGMRTTIILVTQLPKSTQVDSLDLDQHLVSFKWLLIVMGGIFLRFIIRMIPSRKITCCPNQVAMRPGLRFSASRLLCLGLLLLSNDALCVDSSPSLRSRKVAGLDLDQIYLEEQKLEKQQQSLQQLRQEMESGFTDLANKLSALQEIESGFARKLSALTSIGSSNSRNSESSSPRSNARKLQSFASESPVDYQRDCTRHTVDQAVIYRKIIDHFYDQDDIYYNRGAHVLLQFGRKYLTLNNGRATCSNWDHRYPLYRVPAVNGERNKNSFYDPRRPGNYLHLSRTMTIGTEQLGSGDPIDRDRMSMRRGGNGELYFVGTIENLPGYDPNPPLYLCQGDCDHDHECYGDLRCVQREADELVLGCQGSADHHVDYCIMERINLACSSDLAHVTSGRVSMSQHMERKCPYIEKFDGTANSAMNLFLPEKTGFLRTFLDWAVGGVTDIADASERRYAPDRQMSLEVNFDVDISSQNNGGSSKGRLGSYALNINSGWDSFEPWDYFEVRSSEYTSPENGCSRRHSIPRITLYQCSPVHDKEGGYGDSNHWSVFRLIDPPGNFCLSVDSYGVSEDLQQAVCGDLSSVPSGQKFVAFLSESDNSQFVLRPHGAVVENKDVCFHPGGDHTKSRDCHDNEYFFTTSVASPGEMELNFISSGSTSSTFKMR